MFPLAKDPAKKLSWESLTDIQEHQGTALMDRIGCFRIAVQTNRVIPGKVHDNGHDCLPRKLDNDVAYSSISTLNHLKASKVKLHLLSMNAFHE